MKATSHNTSSQLYIVQIGLIIDREAREIIRLVVSVRPSIRLFVCLSVCRASILLSVQIGCALAVDHAFNWAFKLVAHSILLSF